ncbi:MAG: peptidylprolyl isomerase [Planctomycetota bacterium]
MTCLTNWIVAMSSCLLTQAPQLQTEGMPPAGSTVEEPLSHRVRAELQVNRTTVPVGGEVTVEFSLKNLTDEPIRLTVPGALEAGERKDQGMGLPLEHVFSGVHFRALEVASDDNPRLGDRVMRKPEYPVPAITLAPFGSAGLRFDVARFYPGLHQSGVYRLKWLPYGGALEAQPLIIEVVQYKQVVMETEYGTLAIELLYDQAPRHVANFLELIDRRFYNGKVFHTVYPHQFLLGGCGSGDGTGKRPDGLTLAPEFNNTQFLTGTVGMALIEGDPDSASSQFFICLSPQPAWHGRYTAFARVRGPQSLMTLQRLGEAAVDAQHRPVQPLVIKSMTAVDVPYSPDLRR